MSSLAEQLANSLTTQPDNNNPNYLNASDDPYENEAAVIRGERKRYDEKFKPLLAELVERFNGQNNAGAFQASNKLVEDSTNRSIGQFDRRNSAYGVNVKSETRADYMRRLGTQKGLLKAQTATDTADAIQNLENEILLGSSASSSDTA